MPMFYKSLRIILWGGVISFCLLIAHFPLMGVQCPPVEKIKLAFQKVFPAVNLEILKIEPAKIPGLCKIQIKERNQTQLFYCDLKGNYILTGNIFEGKTGKNVTQETIRLLNKLTAGDLLQLDTLTAFIVGRGVKTIYFVTDPHCPYCRQTEPLLKKMAEKEGITVRYLLFPLAAHKGAREQSISTLCDKKGLEGWESAYSSQNQCPEGTKKIDDTASFLQKRGIFSTPTFIFRDGTFITGAMPEDELRSKLGLSKAPQATK